jgi:curved DNA-binding protein CbpA
MYTVRMEASGENFVDYYDLLGVPKHAELDQIRQAYIRLAKEHHPDAGGTVALMQRLNAAYRTLAKSSSRRAYDLMHDFKAESSSSHYRDYGQSRSESSKDLSDDEVDKFIDTIFNEYHNAPKPKKTLLTRLRQFL